MDRFNSLRLASKELEKVLSALGINSKEELKISSGVE